MLHIDIESRNLRDDLKKCGAYRYAQTADVLLLAAAFDDEDPVVFDIAQGEPISQRVLDAMFDPNVIKHAWNAQFERAVLSVHFGKPMSPQQWSCTMALALQNGLPAGLAEAGEALGIEKQKDTVGKALITYFCVPCKATKTNGGRTHNLPAHDPAKWNLFKQYCARDVEAEREIARLLHV